MPKRSPCRSAEGSLEAWIYNYGIVLLYCFQFSCFKFQFLIFNLQFPMFRCCISSVNFQFPVKIPDFWVSIFSVQWSTFNFQFPISKCQFLISVYNLQFKLIYFAFSNLQFHFYMFDWRCSLFVLWLSDGFWMTLGRFLKYVSDDLGMTVGLLWVCFGMAWAWFGGGSGSGKRKK